VCVVHPCCVFIVSLLFVYMCVCMSSSPRSIMGVPSGWALWRLPSNYCTPLVCVRDVIGGLTVWQHNITNSKNVGRCLEHEAASFHTWPNPLGVVPKGATWGNAHQLLLLNFPELPLPFGWTLQPSGARHTPTTDTGACKDNDGHQRHPRFNPLPQRICAVSASATLLGPVSL